MALRRLKAKKKLMDFLLLHIIAPVFETQNGGLAMKFSIGITIGFFCLSSVFSQEPNYGSMQSVFDDYVKQGNLVVNAVTTPSLSPNTAFSQQAFVLWDYAEDISGADPMTTGRIHWQNLINFVKANNITRLITNIKNPKKFGFFADSNPAAQSFAYYASQLPSTCQLAVLFDCDTFELVGPDTPSPDNSYPGYLALPAYFANLPEKLLWVQRMLESQHVNITEVVLDPQNACSSSGGGNGDYQLLIDFMDYYFTENSLSVGKGLTVGVDAHSFTFCNLSLFPLDSTLAALVPANFPPTSTGPQWRSGSTAPMLSSVYVQAYDPQIPYVFTLKNNPTQAATDFLHNFRDEPYLLGNGTISFVNGSTQITGSGTSFLGTITNNIVLDQVVDGMPIGVSVGGSISRVGLSNGNAPSNTLINVYSAIPLDSQTNVPFYQTEIVNKWTYPYITTSMANNIYLMFSFENSNVGNALFFGSWTVDQFMSFLQSFYSQGQSSLPIYMSDPSTNIPLPNNFAIYDFDIFTDTYINTQ